MNRYVFAVAIFAVFAAVHSSAWQGSGKPDAGNTDVQEVRVPGLAFRLQKCHFEASKVACDFSLIPLQGDTAVNFYSKTFVPRNGSRIVTNDSAEFIADTIDLAGKEMSSSTRTPLVAGVAAKGQIAFYGVATQPARIALLKLRGTRTTDKGAGGVPFEVDFRNVALQ